MLSMVMNTGDSARNGDNNQVIEMAIAIAVEMMEVKIMIRWYEKSI